MKKSIKELLDELDPEVFWPIHRGVVVNANAIAMAHRKMNGQFEVRLKARPEALAVSEPFAYRFRQMRAGPCCRPVHVALRSIGVLLTSP